MKFDMVPYVNIYELKNALCEANLYDEDRDGSLRNFLFGDCYYNDSAMRLSFEGDSLLSKRLIADTFDNLSEIYFSTWGHILPKRHCYFTFSN